MPSIAMLRAALFTPTPEGFWGLPILGEGEPGTGKTSMLKSIARTCGLPFHRLSPAERGEGQFGVVPVPGADGYLHYPPPDWSKDLEHGGILFLDEINTAPPAHQGPLLGLVQLRVIGSHTFGPRVRTIGAMNSTEDAAGGWDLSPALLNRFGHLRFDGLDAQSWAVGLLGGFSSEHETVLDAVAEEKRVMEAWPGADAAARGMVAGFIQRRPDLLHKRPARGAIGKAWPSRRSVEYAVCAMAAGQVHRLSETEADELTGAFVGDAWMSEFAVWRRDADLPHPEAVLDGKEAWQHDPRRLDRTMAVLGACAALVAPEKATKRRERAGACWRLIESVIKDAGDCAIPAARVLVAARLIAKNVPEASPVLGRIFPLLSAAGITAS